MKIRSCFAVLFSLVISSANAAVWDNGGITTTIKEVTALQSGEFYITAEHDLCDGEDKVNKIGQIKIGKTPGDPAVAQARQGISMVLSVALAAQLTNKRVRIYADDSGESWGCSMGAIKIIN